MKSKQLDGYRGRLTSEQIAEGMNQTNANAKRLAEDARTLFDAGRFPSAVALSVLSIEEAGKASILRQLALARNDDEVQQAWKDFRKHTKKNAAWILPELVINGARYLEDLRPLFSDDAEHPFVLDALKQVGFYTDCYGKGHWSAPVDAIDGESAEFFVRLAELFSQRKVVAKIEVELWIKHLGPVWKGSMAAMQKGIVNWFDEMKQLGLAEEGNIPWERFILGTDDVSPTK